MFLLKIFREKFAVYTSNLHYGCDGNVEGIEYQKGINNKLFIV